MVESDQLQTIKSIKRQPEVLKNKTQINQKYCNTYFLLPPSCKSFTRWSFEGCHSRTRLSCLPYFTMFILPRPPFVSFPPPTVIPLHPLLFSWEAGSSCRPYWLPSEEWLICLPFASWLIVHEQRLKTKQKQHCVKDLGGIPGPPPQYGSLITGAGGFLYFFFGSYFFTLPCIALMRYF